MSLWTAAALGFTTYSYFKDSKATQDMIDNMKPITDTSLRDVDENLRSTKRFYGKQHRITGIDDDIYTRDLINSISGNVHSAADATVGIANMEYSAGAESKFSRGTDSAQKGFGREMTNIKQDEEQRGQSLLQAMYDSKRTRNMIIADATRAGYTTAGQSSQSSYDNLNQQASSIV